MTGCYPSRIGFGDFEGRWVLFPGQPVGMNPNEITMATLLKQAGYATKHIGKWHCGDQPEFLPTRHGFDSYYGIPYSNDMGRQSEKDTYPPLPLLRDESVIQAQPDQEEDAQCPECHVYGYSMGTGSLTTRKGCLPSGEPGSDETHGPEADEQLGGVIGCQDDPLRGRKGLVEPVPGQHAVGDAEEQGAQGEKGQVRAGAQVEVQRRVEHARDGEHVDDDGHRVFFP